MGLRQFILDSWGEVGRLLLPAGEALPLLLMAAAATRWVGVGAAVRGVALQAARALRPPCTSMSTAGGD